MKRDNGIILPPLLPDGFTVTCRVCHELVMGDAPPAAAAGAALDPAALDDLRFLGVMGKLAAHIQIRHPELIHAAVGVMVSYQALVFVGCCDPVKYSRLPLQAAEVGEAVAAAADFRGWDSEPFAGCLQRAKETVLQALGAKFLMEVNRASVPPPNLKGGH